MLAQTSLQLLKDFKRTSSSRIPPYDEEKMRICVEEMNDLYQANIRDVNLVSNRGEASQGDDSAIRINSVLVRHAVVERNKRSLLAYHYARLMRIKEMRWQMGTLPSQDIRQNLTEAELDWFKNYSQFLAAFMQADSSERGGAGCLDLTQAQYPPKALLVEVRCLIDYGEFETEDGTVIDLSKGSQHSMIRSDAEPLIMQGILEHITS